MIPDATYPGMYRVRWPDGQVSDMVGLPWAKDAAQRHLELMRCPSPWARRKLGFRRRSDLPRRVAVIHWPEAKTHQ